MGQPIQDARTGMAAVDAANDGLHFLLDRLFQRGVECRRGESERGTCDQSLCSRIDAIIRYVSRNFANQEREMADAGYPETEGHRAEHHSLVQSLVAMRNGKVCGDRDGVRVKDFVRLWAIEHSARHDLAVGRWVQSSHPESMGGHAAAG